MRAVATKQAKKQKNNNSQKAKNNSFFDKKTLRFCEKYVDIIIPYLLVLLTIMIIFKFAKIKIEPLFTVLDYIIITFFVVDLIFKWQHVKKIKPFIKSYWLDILAVFPFYLAFRLVGEIAEITSKTIESGQKLAHEAVLLREVKIATEAEKLAKEARAAELLKEGRIGPRIISWSQRTLRIFFGRLKITNLKMLHGSDKHRHH